MKYIRKSKEERQKEIYDAAVRVFLAKGYKNTTMEDIISATPLSKGGFYNYYNNTRDILIDIMRLGNYRFVTGNITFAENASKEDICKILTNAFLDKILTETPERKLYLMFVYEIIYDPDFEKIFLELEKETFRLFDKAMQNTMPHNRFEEQREKSMFLSRVVNALLFVQNLFSDKEIFKENREFLYRILYGITNDLLEDAPCRGVAFLLYQNL